MIKNFFAKKKNVILLFSAILLTAFIFIFAFVILPAIKDKKNFDIENIEIQINGLSVSEFEIPFGGEDVELSVVVNGGSVNYKKFKRPEIHWTFKGNDLGCTINDGILQMKGCDTIGNTIILVNIKSSNEKTAEVVLKVIPKSSSILQSIELTNFDLPSEYVEGQPVNKSNFTVVADFGGYSAKVIDFLMDKQNFTLADRELQITYQFDEVEKNIIIPVSVAPKSLQGIRITRAPDNVTYKEGQKFDAAGMEITADYEYSSKVINDYYFDTDKILSIDDVSVKFYYTENHSSKGSITKTTEQTITVNHRILQALSVDTSHAKLHYVQGQKFDTTGLVVTALYDVGEKVVNDYIVDTQTKLKSGLTDWRLSYAENGVTKYFNLKITVDAPYTNFRKIIFGERPDDATLNWFYFYTTDDGEDKIDNTAAAEHGLAFNDPVGTYVVPVGASVTVEAVNPAITDFYLDGEAQGLKYPSRTIDFTLSDGENPLVVSFKKISNRTTVTFNGDAAKVAFSYPQPWSGRLKENHLEQISFLFDESNAYTYNIYLIDGAEYSFSEISTYSFTGDCIVTVEQRERKSETQVTLVYWDGVEVLISVDKSDPQWQSKLPELERVGYEFIGWEEQSGKMVAQWKLQDAGYSGEFIGQWNYKVSTTVTAECYFTLNSNGTYEYETFIDGELNLRLYGFYEYNEVTNDITVLSIESSSDLLLVAPENFEINFDNYLDTKLFVADGYEIYTYDARFEKASVKN